MLSFEEIHNIATQVIKNEADTIKNLIPLLDDNFQNVVKIMLENKGNIVFSGIGKSAIIAQKIVATMNSTGTSSVFMHAADAIHGDLGIGSKTWLSCCRKVAPPLRSRCWFP